MDLDQTFASALDAMEYRQGDAGPIDWRRVDQLIGDALAIVDAGGQGHGAVGRALSTAYHAAQSELGTFPEPIADPIGQQGDAFVAKVFTGRK